MAKKREKTPLKINFILPGETEEEKEKNIEGLIEVFVEYAVRLKYSNNID